MAEESFKITIEGPGVKVTRELEEKVALQILSVALGNESALTPMKQAPEVLNTNNDDKEAALVPETTTNDVSIGEFMADLKISNNVERIAAVALYLKEKLGRSRTEKSEIVDWFQKAGQAAPKNLPRDIKSAVKKRLIAEDDNNSERFFVTNTGEKALRSTD